MDRRWFIHAFIDSTPHVFQEAAKDSAVDQSSMMTSVEVKSCFCHEASVLPSNAMIIRRTIQLVATSM